MEVITIIILTVIMLEALEQQIKVMPVVQQQLCMVQMVVLEVVVQVVLE